MANWSRIGIPTCRRSSGLSARPVSRRSLRWRAGGAIRVYPNRRQCASYRNFLATGNKRNGNVCTITRDPGTGCHAGAYVRPDAHRDTYRARDRSSYSRTDPNPECVSHAPRDSGAHGYAHTYGYTRAHCDAVSNSGANTRAHGNPNTGPYPDTNSRTHGNPNTGAYPCPNCRSDTNSHAHERGMDRASGFYAP